MAGIYIHIPFCKTRCIYCDFFSSISVSKKKQYVEALCKELELRKDYLSGEEIQTVYFGGGTPSQFSADDFEKIFAKIAEVIERFLENKAQKEISLEANPDDLTPEYLKSLESLKILRTLKIFTPMKSS